MCVRQRPEVVEGAAAAVRALRALDPFFVDAVLRAVAAPRRAPARAPPPVSGGCTISTCTGVGTSIGSVGPPSPSAAGVSGASPSVDRGQQGLWLAVVSDPRIVAAAAVAAPEAAVAPPRPSSAAAAAAPAAGPARVPWADRYWRAYTVSDPFLGQRIRCVNSTTPRKNTLPSHTHTFFLPTHHAGPPADSDGLLGPAADGAALPLDARWAKQLRSWGAV